MRRERSIHNARNIVVLFPGGLPIKSPRASYSKNLLKLTRLLIAHLSHHPQDHATLPVASILQIIISSHHYGSALLTPNRLPSTTQPATTNNSRNALASPGDSGPASKAVFNNPSTTSQSTNPSAEIFSLVTSLSITFCIGPPAGYLVGAE